MNYWLVLIPLLTAFTGWIVIRLLAYFIFHPGTQKSIAGFKYQGILPAVKDRVGIMAGSFIAKEINTGDIIRKQIADSKNFDKLRPLIEAQIDDFLRNRLKEEMPMVGMFIGDRTIDQLKPIFIKEIEKMFPLIMERYSGEFLNDLNLETMAVERIKSMPSEKIEGLIRPEIDKGLKKAYALAIITGLLIGTIQLVILLLI